MMRARGHLHSGGHRQRAPRPRRRQRWLCSIGKRIDALGRIAGLQSRLETVQRELNEVKLEYVRNDEIQRRETARANADNLTPKRTGPDRAQGMGKREQ